MIIPHAAAKSTETLTPPSEGFPSVPYNRRGRRERRGGRRKKRIHHREHRVHRETQDFSLRKRRGLHARYDRVRWASCLILSSKDSVVLCVLRALCGAGRCRCRCLCLFFFHSLRSLRPLR